MTSIKKKGGLSFTISFSKKLKTEFYPIDLAVGLDVLMKPEGYVRTISKSDEQEKFIWENIKGSRIIVGHYSRVNSITISQAFNSYSEKIIKSRLVGLHRKLNDIIGQLSQYLGSPYIASTRELSVEIQSNRPSNIICSLQPIIQRSYKKIENMELFDVDISELTDVTTCIEFRYME